MDRNSEVQMFDRRSALRLGGMAGAAVTAGALTNRPAFAQTPEGATGDLSVQKQSVSLATAKALLEAAEAEAIELGIPMGIAIVDEGGLLKALHRMDGINSAVTIDLVQMKAYSATSFRTPTYVLAGIGVGGGSAEQDQEVAEAALAAVGAGM